MSALQELKDKLQGVSIMIATPCYGGQCSAYYTQSMMQLTAAANQLGVPIFFYALTTESLITRARNYCADEFLRSSSTHLMFIDSDIEFNPIDVLTLATMSNRDSGMDVVCGPYPMKDISWEKVKYAVDKGHADKDAKDLQKYAGVYVFNIDKEVKSVKISDPLKVSEAGTGFMCIHRDVLEKYREARPDLEYTPDHVDTADFNENKKIWCFFNAEIDPDTNRYLSEDYYFCRQVSRLGMSIYVCPWMKLNHIGNYKFEGNLAAMSSIGLSYGNLKGPVN